MAERREEKREQKPDWWPENPYPESIFKMTMEEYVEAVPDPDLRSAIGGCLGRGAWGVAEEMIWERLQEREEERIEDSNSGSTTKSVRG